MSNPINIPEVLDRVAGNREFVIQMLDLFFQTSDSRINLLLKAFEDGQYYELSEQAHKLEGLISNLSIHKALPILHTLSITASTENREAIAGLLKELNEAIEEAKTYFASNPTLK
jgi:HPt (histidine-containing phosphotransfer) domain-containing protein